MKYIFKLLLVSYTLLLIGCSTENQVINATVNTPTQVNYLALGDSYTIGQSVCATCRFPIQLQDSLKKYLPSNKTISTKIIATTGWTTTNLKEAIANQNPATTYDLVTLLIGVNNQYQNKPFSLYEQEFPQLVSIATAKAKGNKEHVIVVSIPDYAFTPFGNGVQNISNEITQYNTFSKNYCLQNDITYINITDITQLGLQQPNLVATDGLHPSELAYTKFVTRILPKTKDILGL